MISFSWAQQRRALIYLSLAHIVIIAASNYLVQFPFQLAGLHNTWGAFTFPFIFLATDLTVRIFGASLARKIIFVVMFPALIVSYLVGSLFASGQFVGFSAWQSLDIFIARIALASFMAYSCGQLLDIFVFDRLRKLKTWWLAPAASTLIGSALDTLIFFIIAFYASQDAYMAEHWFELACTDYAFKLLVSLTFFLPAYGLLLNILQLKIQAKEKHATI